MSNRAPLVEKLVWIYIYVGLLLLGLGLAVQRSDATIGWVIAGIGIVSTVVGIVLIWVRSRMKAGPP